MMRNFINIVDDLNQMLSGEVSASGDRAEFLQLVHDWTSEYDASAIWGQGRIKEDSVLIQSAKKAGIHHKVDGVLYRGQGILDDDYARLKAGETVTIAPVNALLCSWTKSISVAEDFAEVANENHGFSAVVLAFPADQLDVLIDTEQLGDSELTTEREVICLYLPLTISPSKIIRMLDYEE